jgi:hypothetical protein
VLFMTKVREGVPIPAPGAPSGEDEGVDAFNDLLAIVTRCLHGPGRRPIYAVSAYIWAGLHGYAALAARRYPHSPGPPQATTSTA